MSRSHSGRSSPAGPGRRPTLRERLNEPVDGASVAVVRVAFGLILACEAGRYFLHGWIDRYYIEPIFHFTYYGFGWVHPWPAAGMYAHFAVLGAAALLVAAGLAYRASAVVLWAAFTYVFLLDEARYLNHFYAASLFAFILAVVPAANVWSIDALRARRRGSARGGMRDGTVPRWAVWLLRVQVGVIYFFGGIAKLNPDWIHGEPMRSWLLARADAPLIGFIVQNRLELYVFSYGGLSFDLLVTPALLWRRTRPFAFAAAIVFHVINSQLFSIGIFPWMMIAMTTIFFDAGWPRAILARLPARWRAARTDAPRTGPPAPVPAAPTPIRATLAVALGVYVLVQVLVPLRHFAYPGDVAWTEEGHRFSWRMKLREKVGTSRFIVTDRRTGRVAVIAPDSVIEPWQAAKMSARPDMILQFAHFLARREADAGRSVEVRASVQVALNGHESRPLVDSTVDLAAEPRTLWPARWVTRGPDVEQSEIAGNQQAGTR